MAKKIKFQSTKPQFDIPKPQPATRYVPEWYRKMKPVSSDRINSVKKCVPYLDALSTGYMITLPVDIHYDAEKKQFSSASQIELVSPHVKSQTEDVVLQEEWDDQPWKWINNWYIKTPKGYSCLFIHPLNRDDLPFNSFTGVVDTDKHPVTVHFPFVIRKDFSGVIPAGTPLIQVIPFKRDDWTMSVEDEKPYRYFLEHEVFSDPLGWYRHKFWSKKKYQ